MGSESVTGEYFLDAANKEPSRYALLRQMEDRRESNSSGQFYWLQKAWTKTTAAACERENGTEHADNGVGSKALGRQSPQGHGQ